jgi:hypothetical protein
MANNVNSYIELKESNEAAAKFFEEFSKKMAEDQWDAYSMLFGVQIGEEEKTRGWMIDNVGAKWLIVNDTTEDTISTDTAWAPPIDMVDTLQQKLFELDKNVKMSITYEDEMPNFIGYKFYNGDDEDEEQVDSDEYKDILEGFKELDEFEEELGEDEDSELDAWDLYNEQMESFWDAWHDYVYREQCAFFD